MQARAVRAISGGLLLRACVPRHSGPFRGLGSGSGPVRSGPFREIGRPEMSNYRSLLFAGTGRDGPVPSRLLISGTNVWTKPRVA